MILNRQCPNCQYSFTLKERLPFIYQNELFCPQCKGIVYVSILSSCLFVPFGGLAWFFIDNSLQQYGIPEVFSVNFGFLVCYVIIQLGYPLAHLRYIDSEILMPDDTL